MNQVTRRNIALIFGGMAAASAQADTTGKPGTSLHQEIDIPASPERLYGILLDAAKFSAFTKQPAEIRAEEGAPFKLFGARVEGRNVELVPNRRIVQAWRPASWPRGVYSIVRFELAARGSETRITLDHAGFTADKWETLNAGWAENYWEPLRRYLTPT
jgi:activator of HSP90 ATPase